MIPPKRIKIAAVPPGRPASRGQTSNKSTSIPSKSAPSSPKEFSKQIQNIAPSSAIKEMQQSILDFSNLISSFDLNQKPKNDSFSNFLSQQYLDGKLEDLSKQMKRIGSPGMQNKADGIWGANTNQALKYIAEVAKVMMQMAKDLNVQLTGYTQEQLNIFEKDLIPSEYTKATDKEKRAQEIINHIQTIATLFRSFKSTIQNNEQLKSFIQNKESFLNIPQSPQTAHETLDQNEQNLYNKYKDVSIAPSNITMSDMLSLPAFKIYMEKNNLNPNNQEELNKAIQQIADLLG